ncbi:MAG: hypothetical protein RXP86_09530 [Acidilobus sp.]
MPLLPLLFDTVLRSVDADEALPRAVVIRFRRAMTSRPLRLG